MISTILIAAGLVFLLAGLVIFVLPPKQGPGLESVDIAAVLEQLNGLLDRLDKRYRPGLVLMAVGLTLVGLGVYIELQHI